MVQKVMCLQILEHSLPWMVPGYNLDTKCGDISRNAGLDYRQTKQAQGRLILLSPVGTCKHKKVLIYVVTTLLLFLS